MLQCTSQLVFLPHNAVAITYRWVIGVSGMIWVLGRLCNRGRLRSIVLRWRLLWVLLLLILLLAGTRILWLASGVVHLLLRTTVASVARVDVLRGYAFLLYCVFALASRSVHLVVVLAS